MKRKVSPFSSLFKFLRCNVLSHFTAQQLEQLKQWIDDKKLAPNIGDLLAANHVYDLANLIYPENEAKVLEKYVYPELKPIPLKRFKVAIQEQRTATYGSLVASTTPAATVTAITTASKSLQDVSIETQISIGLKEEGSSSFQGKFTPSNHMF